MEGGREGGEENTRVRGKLNVKRWTGKERSEGEDKVLAWRRRGRVFISEQQQRGMSVCILTRGSISLARVSASL